MSAVSPGVRRLCVVTDVSGYSRLSTLDQIHVQRLLLDVIRGGCQDAGAPFRQEHRQDSGDGVLLILPPGLNEPQIVPAMINGWVKRLAAVNRAPLPWGRVRLRAAISQGIVHDADTGYAGDAVITACRLLDSTELREALRESPDHDLALIVPDDLFRDLVAQDYPGLPAREFRPERVVIESKNFATDAWIYLPGPPPHAGGHPAERAASAGPGQSYLRGAADLGMVASALSAAAAASDLISNLTGHNQHDPTDHDPKDHNQPADHDPGDHSQSDQAAHDTSHHDSDHHDSSDYSAVHDSGSDHDPSHHDGGDYEQVADHTGDPYSYETPDYGTHDHDQHYDSGPFDDPGQYHHHS